MYLAELDFFDCVPNQTVPFVVLYEVRTSLRVDGFAEGQLALSF